MRTGKPIARRSAKGKADDRNYSTLAKKYKAAHPVCEANLPGCTKKTEDIHHKAGRGANLCNVDTFLGVCRNCHQTIEQEPEMAKEKGFSVSRLTKAKK